MLSLGGIIRRKVFVHCTTAPLLELFLASTQLAPSLPPPASLPAAPASPVARRRCVGHAAMTGYTRTVGARRAVAVSCHTTLGPAPPARPVCRMAGASL